MATLLIALGAGVAFIIAYHTYGRWLGSKIFRLAADTVCPSTRLRDDNDYVPTSKPIVFGHHFTSIAGTGPIVGPAIAVMWGWLPALLWVVLGSIFIGAVHDFGALVVSLRNNGQTVGDIAGRVLNKRVRLLFLFVLFMALTIVLGIFGLVIGAVFKQYPSAIFPCLVQIPIAVFIGVWLHKQGRGILIPSVIALAVMYLTVIFGDQNTKVGIAFFDETIGGALHWFNASAASWPIIVWVAVLLVYSYVASVLPVWTLLQPRDYINSLQLISALALIVLGLLTAAIFNGAPPVPGAERVPLEIAAPMVNWTPKGAPMIFPFLFITIACGAISGFHCLVSSGTSSKQLEKEPDARFVGYGSMLTEGFLATLVILACVAGLGLGSSANLNVRVHTSQIDGPDGAIEASSSQWHSYYEYAAPSGDKIEISLSDASGWYTDEDGNRVNGERRRGFERHNQTEWEAKTPVNSGIARMIDYTSVNGALVKVPEEFVASINGEEQQLALIGGAAFVNRYSSWGAAGSLAKKVGAFVDGSANFLKAMGIPAGVAVALMGVLVASFAGTTLDTACRLQRYVVQELAATFAPRISPTACAACGYDLSFNTSGACPECGHSLNEPRPSGSDPLQAQSITSDKNEQEEVASSRARLVGKHPPRELWLGGALNPFYWLTNKHVATIFAITIALFVAGMPATTPQVGLFEAVVDGVPVRSTGLINDSGIRTSVPDYWHDGHAGAWAWIKTYSGKGGLILWPLFGATNQLLGGLSFLVIAFYLWRRRIPIWFIVLPLIFMLIMPAWAMGWQLFIGDPDNPAWLSADNPSYVLIFIGIATLLLEAWMIIEAILLWPKVKGVLEEQLPGNPGAAHVDSALAG